MNVDRVKLLKQLRSSDGWIADIRRLAGALRTTTRRDAGLLVVGPPTAEPWHLVAHLEQESRLTDSRLAPVLVRHHVPAGAAPHLAVDLTRLSAARSGETVFVVAPVAAPEDLLTRVQDARRAGATILALEADGDPDLTGLAHETVTIGHQAQSNLGFGSQFDAAQHLVTVAAGQTRSRRFSLR